MYVALCPGGSSTLPVRISLSQRSALEYLKKRDSVTGREVHEVRGKNGQVLTPLELEKEKPIFMKAPLVETGCSYHFMMSTWLGLVPWQVKRKSDYVRAEFHGRPLRSSLWELACPRVLVVPNWHRDQSPGFVLSLRLGFQHTNCKYYWSLVLKV